jgi:protein arginine kinase activator
MLCEECNQNVADVVITVLSNGKATTRHLCKECVAKMETSIAKGDMSGFLTSVLTFLNKQPKEASLTCDACGLTYEEFQSTGRLGCTKCYQVFSEQLKPLLLRVHGRNLHAGHVPQGHEKQRELEQSILDLKIKMELAICAENFEQAAEIRDEIKTLCEQQRAEAKPQ